MFDFMSDLINYRANFQRQRIYPVDLLEARNAAGIGLLSSFAISSSSTL
jgi:hypothetical protein